MNNQDPPVADQLNADKATDDTAAKENATKRLTGTNIDAADFGKIIKSGWGEDPSSEDVKEIEEMYGD